MTLAEIFLFFNHRRAYKILNNIKISQYYDDEHILLYQSTKLKSIIKHSYETVPYYKELFDKEKIKPEDINNPKDLTNIPVLEKETIRKNLSQLTSSIIKRKFVRSTTGSTGVPLIINYDIESKSMEMALMQRFKQDMLSGEKISEIILWGRPHSTIRDSLKTHLRNFIYNTEFINIYNFSEQEFVHLAKKLTNNQNVLLRGFASGIYKIASILKGMDIELNLRAVSVTAEKLFDYQRNTITKYLSKNLYDQYGCGEINSIAFECENHTGLHHAYEHSILEVDSQSLTGPLIITNLDNYAMPLLRYRNGDIITLTDSYCSCGRHGRIIKSIEGRLYDIIIGPNGNSIHSAFLDHIILDSHILERFDVKEIRIIQIKENTIHLQYVSDNTIDSNFLEPIRKQITEKLGDIKIVLDKKDSLVNMKTGKRKFVVPLKDYLNEPDIL